MIAEMAPAPTRRNTFKLEFCQFRIEALYQIARDTHNAELAILARIYELWFTSFKKGSVTLNASWFEGLGFERHTIRYALKAMERSGHIAVERKRGAAPRITPNDSLLWKQSTTKNYQVSPRE
jgi:DNA-binding FadR family transcriptional regulator